MENQVERVYTIKIQGYEASLKNLQQLTAAFEKMDNTKRKLDENLNRAIDAGNTTAVEKLRQKIAELEDAIQKLSKQKQVAAKETALLAKAQEGTTKASKENLSATEADAKAELERIGLVRDSVKYTVALSKEKGKAAKEADSLSNSLKAEANSYKDVLAQQRQLRPFVQTTLPSSTATTTLNGQTLGITDAIAKYKELSAAEQDFRRQFTKDQTLVGEYRSGIISAFKDLGLSDLIKKQRDDISGQLRRLKEENIELAGQLKQTGTLGSEAFGKIDRQLRENITHQEHLNKSLLNIDSALQNTGSISGQITNGIATGFKNVREQIGNVAFQYLGLQAVISKVSEGIAGAKLISDQTTELAIQLNGSSEAADKLTDNLKKIDTRTTVAGLQNISDVALKAGTASKNIEEVTKAVDVVKTAFGNDFGDIESGTETFAKLINIFYDDREITGDRILKIGNSIRALANETTATVPFINDFNGRMAGLKQVFSNFKLSESIGLAAGFQEFKQSAEVASTVLVKVLPKIASDTEKFSKLVGLTKKDFSELINTNPTEALIKVSEALVKNGKDVEAVSESLADSELGSGRITTILATLGGKADVFRERIARAGVTINDTSAITESFDKKNNNLAATIDKVNKKFADIGASRTFQTFLLVVVSSISFLIGVLPVVIGLLSVYGATWAIANFEMIRTRAIIIANNLAFQAQYAWLVITQNATKLAAVFQTAYNTALGFFTGVARGATVATTLLGNAMRLLPIGIILTLIAVLIASFRAFGGVISGTSAALRQQALHHQALNEVEKRSTEIIGDQISKIDSWIVVIKSASASADTKRIAVQKLSEINGRFSTVIKGNTFDLGELKKAYDEVTDSIKLQANVQAASSLSAEKQKDVLQVTTLRQRLETEFAKGSGQTRIIKGLSEADTDLLNEITDKKNNTLRAARGAASFDQGDFDKIKADLKKKEDASFEVYNEYLSVQGEVQTRFATLEEKNKKAATDNARKRAENEKLSVKELQDLIKGVDEQRDILKEGDPKLVELQKKRDDYQARLDALNGKEVKTKAYSGAKLSGGDRDELKNIDSERQRLLSIENTSANEIEKVRNLSFDEEESHLKRVQKINVDALNKKVEYLNQKKNQNAEEKAVVAQSLEQISQLELETSKKIQDIEKKRFADQEQNLKNERDKSIQAAKDTRDAILEDIQSTPLQKAQAQLTFDSKSLDATKAYYIGLAQLNQDYNKQALVEAQKQLDETKKIVDKGAKELSLATLADIDDATEKAVTQIKLKYDKLREDIFKSNKPKSDKDAAVNILDKTQNVDVSGKEQEGLNKKLATAKELLDAGIITAKQYEDIYSKVVQGQQNLNSAIEAGKKSVTSFGQLAQGALSKLFGFAEGSDKSKLLGQTITEAFSTASNAMNSFFDAEQQRIAESNKVVQKRLDLELEQKKNQAQSQAEKDTLDRQYNIKKQAEDRRAFEKNKQIQVEQAKINLAMQLSNLAVVAFAPNPLNILTLGSAGAIMYAIQAALAVANFAINVGKIRSAQFAQGGDVPSRGGRFGGRSHSQGGTPFRYKDNHFEAEVDELAVIRTRNASKTTVFTVTGTQMEIASAANKIGGGVDFRPGARMKTYAYGGLVKRFEDGGSVKPLLYLGNMGENLKPPVNPGSFLNPSNSQTNQADTKAILARMDQQTENLRVQTENLNRQAESLNTLAQQTNQRIDNLKVHVVSKEVQSMNDKIKLADAIGTL